MKKTSRKTQTLFFLNVTVIFICLLVTFIVFFIMGIILFRDKIAVRGEGNPLGVILFLLMISLIIGAVLSVLGAKRITKPVRELEWATAEVARGNFNIQVEETRYSEINEFIMVFNSMIKELKSIETLKTDFVSNISHEFKTPLSVIQAYSQVLKRTDLNHETRKHYQEVLDANITKLSTLTNNILSLSKLENQKIVPDNIEFSLDEQIRETILSLEPEWKNKKIDWELMLPRTAYYGSKELIAQIWQNLIGNAIKFSNDKGKITVSISSDDTKITVRISDNGIGMSEETQKHIFDKFYQGENSRSQSGNGLGLAIVRKVLELSNGNISVKSAENLGSTFIVSLSLAKHR